MVDGLMVVQRLQARAVSTIESAVLCFGCRTSAVLEFEWGEDNRLGIDAERALQRGSLALSTQVWVGTCFPHTILQAACSSRAGEPELSSQASVKGDSLLAVA